MSLSSFQVRLPLDWHHSETNTAQCKPDWLTDWSGHKALDSDWYWPSVTEDMPRSQDEDNSSTVLVAPALLKMWMKQHKEGGIDNTMIGSRRRSWPGRGSTATWLWDVEPGESVRLLLSRPCEVFSPAQTQSGGRAASRAAPLQAAGSHRDQFLFGFGVCVLPAQLGRVLLWESVQVDGNTHQDGSRGKWQGCTAERGREEQTFVNSSF